MEYPVPCDCGATRLVLASAAGQNVPCEACGKTLLVPRLSELRKAVDLGAYESSSYDTVSRLINEGRLPAGKTCMISGMPTTDWLDVELQCEAPHIKKDGSPAIGFILFLLGFWLAVLWSLMPSKNAYLGRDTRLIIPLRIDRQHFRSLGRAWSRRKVRTLLMQVEELAPLFAEYPQSRVLSCKGVEDPKKADFSHADLAD